MAKMLVMLTDRTSTDLYLDVQLHKRGDVVSIRDDSDEDYELSPGIAERLGTYWTVIKMPGVAAADLTSYTAPEPGYYDWGNPLRSKTLQRRQFKFDIASYESTLPTLSSPVAAINLQIKKPAIQDPAVIGTPTNVIG